MAAWQITPAQRCTRRATAACPSTELEREPSGAAWLGGPYCESGDVLIEAIALPEIQPGELLAVPVSGAYQLSMASNYNGALPPGGAMA